MNIKKILPAAAVLFATVAAPTAAQALPSVGIADQSAAMFDNTDFEALGVKNSRLIVAYDALDRPNERATTDSWVAAARRAGVSPLITFNYSNANPKKRPTVGEYTRAVRQFRARYPHIKTYSAWNEANHKSQPTFHRPKTAASYYNALRANCSGCKIVALDVLDQGGMVDYVKEFKRYAKKPKIWGLHNYRDTNRFKSNGTAQLLAITSGEVWMTETGGIVAFPPAFPYNLNRASRALDQMFKIARSDPRLKRLYIYAWGGEFRGHRFDAGLVSPTGTIRPSYTRVKQNLRGGKVKGGPKIPRFKTEVQKYKAQLARRKR